jgi:hypothetical protein
MWPLIRIYNSGYGAFLRPLSTKETMPFNLHLDDRNPGGHILTLQWHISGSPPGKLVSCLLDVGPLSVNISVIHTDVSTQFPGQEGEYLRGTVKEKNNDTWQLALLEGRAGREHA